MNYQSRASLIEQLNKKQSELEFINARWAEEINSRDEARRKATKAEDLCQRLLTILEAGAKEGRFPRQ